MSEVISCGKNFSLKLKNKKWANIVCSDQTQYFTSCSFKKDLFCFAFCVSFPEMGTWVTLKRDTHTDLILDLRLDCSGPICDIGLSQLQLSHITSFVVKGGWLHYIGVHWIVLKDEWVPVSLAQAFTQSSSTNSHLIVYGIFVK